MQLTARHPDRPGFRPLYQQVRDLLLARISTGAWRPAEALPSEQALAVELGVSQGTVRKAIDSLVADKLIERRQGKGTYVAQHTQESAQFRFFRLTDDTGTRIIPECRQSTISRRLAKNDEQAKLTLANRDEVYVIKRNRYAENQAILTETIIVPALIFPGLDTHHPLPNTLYTLYQSEFGISIATATEQVKAIAADKKCAQSLGIETSTPVLSVERLALDLTERPIEFRHTIYRTENLHYDVDLD